MSGYCSTGSRRDAADAGQHDEDGDDPGEDRPVDEDPRDHQSRGRDPSSRPWAVTARSSGHRRHRLARLDAAEAFDDQLVAGGKPARYQPLVADGAIRDHLRSSALESCADDERRGIALHIARDALLGREDRGARLAPARTRRARTCPAAAGHPDSGSARAPSRCRWPDPPPTRRTAARRRAHSGCRPRAPGSPRPRRAPGRRPRVAGGRPAAPTLDCWMSTKIGSSRWMVVSGSAWPADHQRAGGDDRAPDAPGDGRAESR